MLIALNVSGNLQIIVSELMRLNVHRENLYQNMNFHINL